MSPTSIFAPVSTPADSIFVLSVFVLAVTAGIFVVVFGLLVYAVVRFRRRRDDDGSEPPQVYGSYEVELAWTIVPVLIVVALFLATARVIASIQHPPKPKDALDVVVIGHQYWWECRYPKFGVVSANELHVPVSDPAHPTPTFLTLLSADTDHSFWVPRLAGKTDLIPNHPNSMWIDPRETGLYLGQCAQYCGTQHAKMLLRVYVDSREDFDRWIEAQRRPARADAAVARGRQVFETTACVNCHAVGGTNANGRFGPDLSHFMSRDTLAAGAAPDMPHVFGLSNYMAPLLIGARDMAFPRLNAFSFWLTAFGGLLLYFSFLGGSGLYGAGNAPDVGWFAYAPLTAKTFSPGHSTDYWTLALLVSGFGSIGTAINILTTILCMRCPGMTLGRMPLLAWLSLTMAVLAILAVRPLSAAQLMLLVDRYLGGHFFDTQAGGSAVMWMHFFWVFGHPEVYVLVIPAFAFASEIIPVFSRKPIFGYPVMVAATVCIGFISMSVWAHHMFTVGMSPAGNGFFVLSTMAIAVPTGIKIFNWLATMWGGKIQFRTPMLFCTAFLFQFLIAGLTGIMLGSAPFDWHLGNSYFVVAHFHYVIVGAILFTVFAAFYYWFPKFSGRLYSETLGRLHFWLFFIGFHLTFDCIHIPGILGMPRRI